MKQARSRRRAVFVLSALVGGLFAATATAACTSNGDAVVDDEAGTSREAGPIPAADAKAPDGASVDGSAFDPSKVCAQELAYFDTCKIDPKQVNCTPAKFEAWCSTNQSATDSDQRVRAKAACLNVKHCGASDLKACIYETYNTLSLSPAQTKLVADYCATCEPGSAACVQNHVKYNPSKGPGSVDDLYLAAWELSEKLVVAIDQKCTGAPFADAGADAGTCDRRFAQCAGGLFVDALPDCPK